MSGGVAVSVEGVSKQYARRGTRALTLTQLVRHPVGPFRRDRLWALRDVSFELRAGESLALVGANGSGKSTLLRLVGGLGKPTRGRVTRFRQVEAMLSLGDTLDPLLTGRENALTAGILAGYRRREVSGRLDGIAAFAELEEVFDHPLRTYSDGMRLRLAFAVAVSTTPEVILIDEVLSVGDLRFQQKCFDRLDELRAGGTTVLLASHDEGQVRRLCDRALWLARGTVQAQGPPDDVLAAYTDSMRVETERRVQALVGREASGARERHGTGEVEIVGVRVIPDTFVPGDADGVQVEIDLDPRVPVENPIVSVSLHRVADFAKVLDVSTSADGARLGRIEALQTVRLVLDRLDIPPGAYRFDVGVYEREWTYVYDYHWHAYPLQVVGEEGSYGPARRWLAV